MLPADELAAVGLGRRDVIEGRAGSALSLVVGQVAARAMAGLAEARALAPGMTPAARACLLPGTLARAHRRALARAGDDPFRLDGEQASTLIPLRLAWHAFIRRM